MSARNKKSGKIKRSSAPFLKFTITFILIVIVGFFIFYSIDNPDFLKSKFSFLLNRNEDSKSSKAVSNLLVDSEVQSVDKNEESTTSAEPDMSEAENTTAAITTINEDTSGGDNEFINNDGSETGFSFWEKIKNFFTGQGKSEEKGEVYPSKLEINFYFSGLGEEKKFVSEKRTINAGSPDIAAANAVQELLKGPAKSYHFPVIPAGTKLLGVETKDNIAKIDLSQEFLENSLDTRILDEYIIYSIVNTLTEIPEIEGVIFYIEGVRIRMYGNVDLSIPAIRNKEYIKEE